MSSKNKSNERSEEFSVYFNPLRFGWHVGEMVAGSARPGRYQDINRDCETLQEQGIDIIINLCSDPLDLPSEYSGRFEEFHELVLDGHPPAQEQLERIISLVSDAAGAGKRVVVHCRGGVGRTATVLIPLIMDMEGLSLEEAVKRLRKAGRYTQTMDQWEFLKSWAQKDQPAGTGDSNTE